MIQRQFALTKTEIADAVIAYITKRDGLTGTVKKAAMDMHQLANLNWVFLVDLDIEEPEPPAPGPYPAL